MSLFSLKPMGLGSVDNARTSSASFSTPQEKKLPMLLAQRMISSEPRPTATFNHCNVIRDSFDAIYRSTPLHPLLKAANTSILPPHQINQPHMHSSPALPIKQHHPLELKQYHSNHNNLSLQSTSDAYGSSNHRQHESVGYVKFNSHQFLSNEPSQFIQRSPHYFDDSPPVNRKLIPLAQKFPPPQLTSPVATVHSASNLKSAITTASNFVSSSAVQSQVSIGLEPPMNVPIKRSHRTGDPVLLGVAETQKRPLPPPPPFSSSNSQDLVVNDRVQSGKRRSDQLSNDHFSQLKDTTDINSDSESTFEQTDRSQVFKGKSTKFQCKNIPETTGNFQDSDDDTSGNNNKAGSKKRKRTSFSSSLQDEKKQNELPGKPTRSGRISRPVKRLPGLLDTNTDPDSPLAPPKNVANRKHKTEAVDDKPAASAAVKSKDKKVALNNKKDLPNSSRTNAWDDIETDYNPQPAHVPVRKWEKEETVALYNVHSLSDLKNPNFWLDISLGLQRLGYQRSEEECNQKWNEGINLMFERKSKKIAKDKMKIEERCLEKLAHNTYTAIMVGKATNSVKEEFSNNAEQQSKKRQVLGKNDKKILLQQISKATREDDIFDSHEFKSKRVAAASPLTLLAGMEDFPTPPVTHDSLATHQTAQGKSNNNEPLFQRDNVQKLKRIKPQLIASIAQMKPLAIKKRSKGHALDSTGDICREIDRAVKKSLVEVLGSSDEDNEDEELDNDDDDDYDEEIAKQRRIYSTRNDQEGEDDVEINGGIEHDL